MLCNSIQSCSNYVENRNGSSISFSSRILIKTFTINKGYNYLDQSIIGNVSVSQNSIPVLNWGSTKISIDTSNGTKYSDYSFNGYDRYYATCDLKRINLNLNWRYYVRFYYNYDQNINNIQINKTYSSIQNEYNIQAWLNLTNNVKYNWPLIISCPSIFILVPK